MCFAGAKGETAKELKSLLNFDNFTDEEVMNIKRDYITHLNNLNGEIALHTANKIYPSINTQVKPEFVSLIENNFKSEVQALDFSRNEESAETINQWVSNKTKDKIKELIAPDTLDRDTGMVLVNAIYFKGNWLNRFYSELTLENDFYLANGATQTVEMMTTIQKFIFKRDPTGLKALTCQFPYIGDSVAMTIILPHKGVQLSEIENKLNEEILKNVLLSNVEKTLVEIDIPKFKFEFKIEVNLNLKFNFDK